MNYVLDFFSCKEIEDRVSKSGNTYQVQMASLVGGSGIRATVSTVAVMLYNDQIPWIGKYEANFSFEIGSHGFITGCRISVGAPLTPPLKKAS